MFSKVHQIVNDRNSFVKIHSETFCLECDKHVLFLFLAAQCAIFCHDSLNRVEKLKRDISSTSLIVTATMICMISFSTTSTTSNFLLLRPRLFLYSLNLTKSIYLFVKPYLYALIKSCTLEQ